VKCNTDRWCCFGLSGQTACAGIFRNIRGENIGCFTFNIGIANAVYAEIFGIILAVKFASERNWNNLRIEADSRLATLAIKSSHIPGS